MTEQSTSIQEKPLIIYIVNARIPTQKAHGVQIMHTCEALARSGARVELVIPHRRTDIKVDPFEYYSVEPVFSIRKVFVPDLIWAGPIGFVLHEWLFVQRVKNYLKQFNSPQIVYVRGEMFFLKFASLATRHRMFFESHIKPKNFEKDLPQYLKTAGIVVVTKYYKRELESAGFADRVLWAPDGVDLRLFAAIGNKDTARQEFQLPLDKTIVGYVGKLTTMEQDKGVDHLLQAFFEVWQRNKNAYLLIVGATDHEQPEVSRQLIELGIPSESFKVVGHVPHAKALNYMRVVDVLIMNYPDSAHYAHYMSPLKLFEYMASGVPIISTDLPSVRDVLHEKNALLVPPGEPGALATAIDTVFSDPQMASALAQQARIDVTQYSWEARARSIFAFIRNHL
jgi:glycosyltransferase involved in cell wall biosynthesis